MGKLLKDVKDVNLLLETVKKCYGDVILRKCDGSEEFNLKSELSRYIAIGELAKDGGDKWEVFCLDRADEGFFYDFFREVKEKRRVKIGIGSTQDLQNFITDITKCSDGNEYTIENASGHYRAEARSLIGVMYAANEFGGEMYLVNETNDGVFPKFVEKYKV